MQLFCLFNRVYSRKKGAGDEKMKVLSDLIQCSVLMHLLDAIGFATAFYFAFAPFGDRLGKIMLCFSNLPNGIMVFSFIGLSGPVYASY